MTLDNRYVGKFEIPLQDFIGIRFVQSEPTAVVEVDITDNIRGPAAPVHGAALCALADTACGLALGDSFDAKTEFPVSVDLHVRFFGQPKTSPLRAEATAVHKGRKIIGAECVITDGTGRQVARASGTYMIVQGFGDTATGDLRGLIPEEPTSGT